MTPTLAAFRARTRPVDQVPQRFGPPVYVRSLTLAELQRCRARAAEVPPPDGTDRQQWAGLWLCAFALCEPDGVAWFPEPTAEDLGLLDGPAAVVTALDLDAIAEAAARLNSADKGESKN